MQGGVEPFGRPSTVAAAGGQPPLPTKMELGSPTTTTGMSVATSATAAGVDSISNMAFGTPLKPMSDLSSKVGGSSVSKVTPSPSSSSSSSSSSTKKAEKTPVDKNSARKKKKWKKPKDKPNRPLSAYNLFFAKERADMLGDDVPSPEQEALKKRIHCKTHGKIPFAVMAREIGAKWKALDDETKKPFVEKATKLKEKYLVELSAWKETQSVKAELKAEAAKAAAAKQKSSSAEASARRNGGDGSSGARSRNKTDPEVPSAVAMSHAAFMAKRMSMAGMPNPMMFHQMDGSMGGMGGFMNGMNGMNGISHMGMNPMDSMQMSMNRHGLPQLDQREQRQQSSSPIQRSGSGSPTTMHHHQQQRRQQQHYDQQPNFAAEASANALMMQFNDAYPGTRAGSSPTNSSSTKSSSSNNRRKSSTNSGSERLPTPREQQHAAMLAERERMQHFANMRRLQQRAFMSGGLMNMSMNGGSGGNGGMPQM